MVVDNITCILLSTVHYITTNNCNQSIVGRKTFSYEFVDNHPRATFLSDV